VAIQQPCALFVRTAGDAFQVVGGTLQQHQHWRSADLSDSHHLAKGAPSNHLK
jgi:hypothetical protein